ncbi:MAG: hypothetical protein N2117_01290 [Anaerolineales bacterium]|nr:hypothetical protein [Anaerolineales bacterium]MCX7753866.1 hypothetical protein [Anaerolineales bacterium]MDW8277251.1 hypothetical protein [Anaerolineales bacterium]
MPRLTRFLLAALLLALSACHSATPPPTTRRLDEGENQGSDPIFCKIPPSCLKGSIV